MTPKLLLPIALAVLALAACGEDEPAPAAETVVEAPADSPPPDAAPPVDAAPESEAAALHAEETKNFPKPGTTVTMAHDEIGVKPAKNIQEAYNTANVAFDRYCEQTGMDRASFYIKDATEAPDRWTVTFFGAPSGVAMYVTMYVFPDGRYEIVR